MTRFQKVLTLLVCLYGLYLAKSAAGINISERYHAVDLVRVPVKKLVQVAKAHYGDPEKCSFGSCTEHPSETPAMRM